jgi:glycosyltransferase involved in cell wall biosynthesis
MSSGVPVVADFRFPDAYGTAPPILRATSVQDVAAALETLLDDPARLADVAVRSRQWVIAEHAAAHVASRVSDVYAEATRR